MTNPIDARIGAKWKRQGRRFLALLSIAFLSFATASAGADDRPKTPNVIFILADDLGWTDLGGYGRFFLEFNG